MEVIHEIMKTERKTEETTQIAKHEHGKHKELKTGPTIGISGESRTEVKVNLLIVFSLVLCRTVALNPLSSLLSRPPSSPPEA